MHGMEHRVAFALPPARGVLAALIKRHGEDCSSLSRLIGRRPDYLGRYIRTGSPRRLRDEERETLARYFRVDEAALDDRPKGEAPMAHPSPNAARYRPPAKPSFADWLLAQKGRDDAIGRLAKGAAQDRAWPRGGDLAAVWQRLNQLGAGADAEVCDAMSDAEMDFLSY